MTHTPMSQRRNVSRKDERMQDRHFNECLATACVLLAMSVSVAAQSDHAETRLRFEDITEDVGLGPEVVGSTVARCLFADVNGDGRADVIVQSLAAPPGVVGAETPGAARWPRVLLHVNDARNALGFRYAEVERTGLPALATGDGMVFADLDNDGHCDAIVTRYIDANNEKWEDHGERTAWLPGRGDGTFGERQFLQAAHPATTSAVAVGDADRDGRLDLYLGNWYRHYGPSLAGFDNDLLLQTESRVFRRVSWSTDGHAFSENDRKDLGGRPTYGAMMAELLPTPADSPLRLPEILELNYGRRWNRLYQWNPLLLSTHRPDLAPGLRYPLWQELAERVGIHGDAIRHGRYPDWLKERAKTDSRFDRDDEAPFRSNGNTFDCAVGDIDDDGDWDVFLAEITHGWAGDSSDRSRFLLNSGGAAPEVRFLPDPRRSVDRIPQAVNNWNQGDLFAELGDFDLDGRLDLLLSSGDYPDDQRLRLYLQQSNGAFRDLTQVVGLDHDGSQQISLSDVDANGSLDVLVGQTFNRFTAEQRAGREPRLRLWRSVPDRGRRALELRLRGDVEAGVNRDALGAVVQVRLGDTVLQRQLVGIGGHAGKQHDFLIHFGLGFAPVVDELVVIWPDAAGATQRFSEVEPGRYELAQGGTLEPSR